MRFVSDTHCLLWYLKKDARLSESSKRLFDLQEGTPGVVVPTIVLAELFFLFKKYPAPLPAGQVLDFLESGIQFEIHPLSATIIREVIPLTGFEIHDALIMATAIHLEIPLMTADRNIRESGLVPTLTP